MADIPMAGAGPDRRGGVGATALVIATIVLAVAGTNIAVGAFLWLALDARMANFEARTAQIDARMANIEAGQRDLQLGLRELSTRVGRIEGHLGVVAAPAAAER